MGGSHSVFKANAICDRCAATDIPGRTRWRTVTAETIRNEDNSINAYAMSFVGASVGGVQAKSNPTICPIGSHYWWVYQYSQAIDSMYVFHEYAYTGRTDFRYIKYYMDYMNMVLRQYYQDMSDTFNSHPIGYILADLENLENPEYLEIIEQAEFNNTIKTQVNSIVSNFLNTKPYPPPGILCVAGYTINNCSCSFDGQSMWWAGRYYKYGCSNGSCANDDHHLCG